MAKDASAGNRTRAARVAGDHSTIEPPMLVYGTKKNNFFVSQKSIICISISMLIK